jgi:hypothetical protein
MTARIVRNGKLETYKIDSFEISNYNEGYVSLKLKGVFINVLDSIIRYDIKDLQEVFIKEDEKNDGTGT